MSARALMFQGTGSDVGKSRIVAGLARAFADKGMRVRPFKPQNMSNNAAVTADGGEIGRAQALQARAARADPSVHMNPVLLKPQSEIGAQVVVQGKVFAFARAADIPVALIGDIDRGGVIASLVGTKSVIDANDAALIRGFLVNKFRGDPALFADGMDALALDQARQPKYGTRIRVAAIILPHVANFDDLDPLEAEPAVDLVRVKPGAALPGDAALVILPGSKATIADMGTLRAAGFHIDIAAHVRRGGRVLGLCGGYQMLGRSIADPAGHEGPPGATDGLALLDVKTVLSDDKRLTPARGTTADGAPFSGYEMHMGTTDGPDRARPFARHADGTQDGAVSANGRVMGTYIHGLFADDRQRAAWLALLGAGATAVAYDGLIEDTLDRLAAHLAAHIDLER